MTHEDNAPLASKSADGASAPKRAWQTPSVEDVPFSHTESSPGPGATYDFALYNPAASH